MKKLRFNYLYWILLPVLAFGLYKVALNFNNDAQEFFGFAENKETQINLENPLLVNKIHVTPGQSVTKGQLLMEVTRTELDWKLSDVNHNITELEAKNQLTRAELVSTINRLKAQRIEKVGAIQSQLNTIEAEIAMNEYLIKDTKTISKTSENLLENNPNAVKIKALNEELKATVQPYDVEIAHLEKQLKSANPVQEEINRLKTQRQFIEKEQKRLLIYAPSDGLVGNVHCKEGENISSFSPLISFYEKSPNLVIGYINESLIVEVNIGDSIKVVSSVHPLEQTRGKVIGLGHRIVEIPERLRKIPTLKTFGREVLIQIQSDNKFLQGETVILNSMNKPTGFFSSFNAMMKNDTKQL